VEVDAVPQSRPDSDSGRPRRFVVDGGTVLGLALLLVVGWGGYVLLAPEVLGPGKMERAIRAAHPEFSSVSCKLVSRSFDNGTSYSRRARSSQTTRCADVLDSGTDSPSITLSPPVPTGNVQRC